MHVLQELTSLVQSGANLSPDQARAAALTMPDAAVAPDLKQAFLTALHTKGESVEEVTAFANAFRELATNPELEAFADQAIDVVGTGGSGSGGYNISSVTAFALAAAGVPVIKHGNRAITSQSGAADFLAEFGVPNSNDPSLLQRSVRERNFCFLFAPAFHPAFKAIVPVRQAMAAVGQRSIFNILGPLINPARPARQLLGVFASHWARPLADALHALGLRRGLAVHSTLPGGIAMDELTTAGANTIAGFGSLHHLHTQWMPDAFALPIANPDDLRGGSAAHNVAILNAIFDGNGPEGLADSLAFNIAVGLFIAERAKSVAAALPLAQDILRGGTLRNWINDTRTFYADVCNA